MSPDPAGRRDPARTPPATLQTVERALAVLEMVAASEVRPTARMIADGLGLNITTTYHLINTLTGRGYLVREPEGGLRMGAQVAALHAGLLRQGGLARDLISFVRELRGTTGETAYATELTERGVVLGPVVESEQSLRVSGLRAGMADDGLQRATSHAVLAFADPRERERLLATQRPAARRALLKEHGEELDAIRERGWAVDVERHEAGVCEVAAPIFDVGGAVAGALGVAIPASRWGARRGLFVGSVAAAARAVSWHLGHQPGPA